MIRYYYYLIFLNMLANIILFVPRVLINHRFEGSIMAILFSIPIGCCLLYLFTRSILRFPGQDFPTILEQHTPAWFRLPVLAIFCVMWLLAGSITLVTFSELTRKFINPDVPSVLIALAYVIVIGLIARISSDSVLYSMEILMILNVPVIAWLLYKATTNDSMNYDACFEIATHVWNVPEFETIAAGTYIFTGYTNMIIFNRVIGQAKMTWFIWCVPVIGTGVLLTSFLIPIGFHGTIAVSDFVFPWISAADSMRVEFGLVERVLYIFMLLYTNISLAGSFIHWHVSIEIIKKITPKLSKKTYFSWVLVAVFGLLTLYMNHSLDDEALFKFGVQYLNVRFVAEAALVLIIVVLARRKAS